MGANNGMFVGAPNAGMKAAMIANLATPDITSAAYGFLTPDTLMTFCASRLRGIDDQCNNIFRKQAKRNDESAVLSDLSQKLAAYKSGFTPTTHGEKERNDFVADIEAAYAKAIEAVGGPESALGQKIVDAKKAFDATKNDAHITAQEASDMHTALSEVQKGLNQAGEMEMLQLQSLMSQRQQAIQICTNLVQSLGQQSMSIAQNTGK